MRYKKIVSGILACAMVVTSVFTGNVTTAKAAEQPTPVGSYSFNAGDVSGDNGTLGDGVTAVVTGLTDYSGDIVYGEGRTGEASDKAVKLGDYGLKLNHANLGTDYTVSMWVKPDGTLNANQVVLFIGNSTPEKWLAIAGNANNTNDVKLWTRNGTDADTTGYNTWTTLTTASCPSAEWTMFTFSQSGSKVSMYVNGELVGTDNSMAEVMNGEDQSIWLGVNYWDPEFAGLVDDVNVYNTALDAAQVRYLYDGASEETIFDKEGFTATEALTVSENGNSKIKVNLPSAVTDAKIEFTSADDKIATVDEEGTVTGVKVGDTTITIKVTVGNIVKTQETKVTVKEDGEVNSEVAVEYDLSKSVNDELVDISGHGNNATIHNPENVEFIEVDGKTVMNIKTPQSYLDLPMGIMDALSDKEAFTIETTYARSAESEGMASWLFCFGSIPKDIGTNYMFYCPYFAWGGNEVRAGIKNSSTEKLFSTGLVNNDEQFYTVNMVFDHGTIKLYLDGVKVGGELKSGYSIVDDVITNGTQDDILGYIGKSCWGQDTNFMGKISKFKIYNKAMTDEDVQLSDPYYTEVFQKNLDEGMALENILGSNASASEVKYNMFLSSSFNENDVTWTSSNPDVVSETGIVKNGAADQEVTLKATVTSGALVATKEFTVTVKALDKAELQTVLAEAQKAYGDVNASEASRANLKKAMDKAQTAASQAEVDSAVKELRKAINKLEYSELYKDPFSAIDDSKLAASKTIAPNASAAVFTVPAAIKDMVTVSYSSSNTAVATVNANGVVTGKKIGYTRVTATVTAKYDNFEMEYQTLVKVDLDMTKVTAKAKATALAKGKTTTISVSYPAAVKNAKPVVTYRATGAVSVNTKGKVTAKSAGTGKVYVTVKAAGKSITKTVTVKVGEITGKNSVKVKKSITLKVNGLSGKVKWSLDKKGKKLATISQKGKLTAKKAGKVKVTAKVGKVTMTKTITIKK